MVTSYFSRPLLLPLRIMFNYTLAGWDCVVGVATSYGKVLESDLSGKEILWTYTDRPRGLSRLL